MGRWITKNGAHIYIEKGQSLEQALAERYAINTYVSSESYLINDALRNGYELDDRLKEVIKNLDSALETEEDYDGPVSRSVSFYSRKDLDTYLKEHDEGKTITYKEFISTTASGELYDSDAQVQLYWNSKHGKNMIKYNKSEMEVLYKRNSTFIIKRIRLKDGQYHIFMEEL